MLPPCPCAAFQTGPMAVKLAIIIIIVIIIIKNFC